MSLLEFFSRAFGVTAILAAAGWLVRRVRRRDDRQLHVQRLAAEIVEVVRSIEVDLRDLPRSSQVVDLALRCTECQRRTMETASQWRMGGDALEDAIGQLHDDHRRVVDLRSEVDVLMVAHRSGQPVSREYRFSTGSKPGRSRFATTGLLTRPSTLG